ncbi:hypothetical protein, partial [Pantoea agglomerans]|uniref:hypothetical protein n=1 Tax=Enterobacter agglomerans TaxID=549 RepID=UPI001F5CCAE8
DVFEGDLEDYQQWLSDLQKQQAQQDAAPKQDNGNSAQARKFVAEEVPVRLSLLTLSNLSGKTRNLSITGYVEWVLGELAS